MKLNIKNRTIEKKLDAKRMRRNGVIPGVLYRDSKGSDTISVLNAEMRHSLRHIASGHLPTTVFELTDEAGKNRKAIVKGIEYHPTTYDILHLDFEELKADKPIRIKVPIECLGAAECAGVKQGGVLRQPIRHIRVSCLPKDLPKQFEIDVKNLELKHHLKLSAISLPKGVKPLDNLNSVVAVVAKR